MLILVITWATQCSARHTEGTGGTDGRELRAAGREDWSRRQGKEMAEDGRRGRKDQGTGEGARRDKKWLGHDQQ